MDIIKTASMLMVFIKKLVLNLVQMVITKMDIIKKDTIVMVTM